MIYFDANDHRSIKGKMLEAQCELNLKCEVQVVPMLDTAKKVGNLIVAVSTREVSEIHCASDAIKAAVLHAKDNILTRTAAWNAAYPENRVTKIVIGVMDYGRKTVRYGTAIEYAVAVTQELSVA